MKHKVLLVGGGLSGGGGEVHFNTLARWLYGGSSDVLLVARPGVPCRRQATIPLRSGAVVSYSNAVNGCLKGRYEIVLGCGRFPSVVASCLQACFCRNVLLVLRDQSVFLQAHSSDARWWKLIPLVGCRVAYGRAHLLLANSESGAAELTALTQGRVPVARVKNPIDSARIFAAAKTGSGRPKESGPYILALGRLGPMKRFDMAILGFSQAGSHGSHRLLIAGDGPERRRLTALAKRLGLEGRVIFLGWVQEPMPLLAGADALIHTSTIEGYPNAVLEAMILRVPVISGDWGEDARSLSRRGALRLVDSGDPQSVGCAIQQVLQDRLLRDAMLREADREVAEHMIPQAIQRYEDLLDSALTSVRQGKGT